MDLGERQRRYADVALGVLLLAIVALMIVPLPTALLDLLIASNLAIAVVMLLLAMAIPDGLAFTAMPTVLLVTTLFRLSLNVSSTRLILLQADAGSVIRAFGEYVVAGNYAVGAVVFAILTLVQYVVVARGAERVAEVSARFTLDAMPGKQMAIDADLRAGGLTVEAARERRRMLEREGQFYGAMDGAMKFVKGDAIAGVAITFINLFAGAGIGVGMRGLSLRESLTTYGLLTVGDGLVCQIPSLLIATSAGLVVTRVASGDERASLGHEVSAQLFGNPRVLAMSGGFLLVLALLPGMPALPFAALAAALLAGSAAVRRARAAGALQRGAAPRRGDALPDLAPLTAELDPALHTALERAADAPLRAALDRARDRLSQRLGMPWPALSIASSETLERGHYRIALYAAPIETRALPDGTPAVQADALAGHIERIVAAHAGELLGLQEAQTLLRALERTAPALVRESVPKPVSLRLLTDVLRCLLAEGVSVRALAPILETLAAAAPGATVPELAERVRARLARQITATHARDGVLAVHLVDPLIEDALRDALPARGDGALALPPDQARDIVAAVRHAAGDAGGSRTVLLTQADLRRHLRKLLAVELPDVVVLSFPELDPEARIERRAPIRIGAPAPAAPRAQAAQ